MFEAQTSLTAAYFTCVLGVLGLLRKGAGYTFGQDVSEKFNQSNGFWAHTHTNGSQWTCYCTFPYARRCQM